jgi:hypothetical protein
MMKTTHILIVNVHRLKVRRDRKLCGIIARFAYFKDKETVLKAAHTSLRDKPQKIYSQFPQEIGNRRRELVPIMKDFRDSGHRAYIDVDKLFRFRFLKNKYIIIFKQRSKNWI